VLQPLVRAQGAEERLLPRVLGALTEQPPQVPEHLVSVLEVEVLERRDLCLHDLHHR
jgi:hypothetical protein